MNKRNNNEQTATDNAMNVSQFLWFADLQEYSDQFYNSSLGLAFRVIFIGPTSENAHLKWFQGNHLKIAAHVTLLGS